MAKKKRKKVPRQAELTQSRAAGLAAATRGRARTFDDKRKEETPAQKQIEQQLKELNEE
jgi:hypothetical protein